MRQIILSQLFNFAIAVVVLMHGGQLYSHKESMNCLLSVLQIVGYGVILRYYERNEFQELANFKEATLQDSKKQRLVFASVIHELRNPLNALLGLVELISVFASGVDKELIKSARTCGDVILQLIANVLDFSKQENGKLEITVKKENMKEQISNLIEIFRPLAAKKELYIRAVISAEVPDVLEYDPTRIGQVMNNLIGNAIKFTQSGGIYVKLDWYPIFSQTKEQLDSRIDQILSTSSRKQVFESYEGILFETMIELDVSNEFEFAESGPHKVQQYSSDYKLSSENYCFTNIRLGA